MTSATHPGPARAPKDYTADSARDLLDALACWLESHAQQLDALNVFPVPDGDTGANMARTLRAASDGAGRSGGSVREVFNAAARGALLGAAGNSGVILSQMIRGFSECLQDDQTPNASDLKSALSGAATAGYRAVATPVEGTMLTVAREAAEAITSTQDLQLALNQALNGAADAVAATPLQLEKLRAAGVVDAGGEGLRLILDGVKRWVDGENLRAATPAPLVSRALVGAQHTDDDVGFCTQFTVEQSQLEIAQLREALQVLSTSLIVVGTRDLIRVHAHAQLPGAVLDTAVRAGVVNRISIENMQSQNAAARAESSSGSTGIIVVAPNEKSARLLESLGAHTVVIPMHGAPTVQELRDAVQRLGHEHLLILPNDKNSLLAAEHLATLSPRSIRIVPTENIAQGIQCLLSISPESDLEQHVDRLSRAARNTTCIELARATRATTVHGVPVSPGDTVAICAGSILAAAVTANEVIQPALKRLGISSAELITMYTGAEASPAATKAIADELVTSLPPCEVETVDTELPGRIALLAIE
jgi:DAK2 domain fusion protein YloV